MSKRRLTVLAFALAAPMVLAACGSQPTIKPWVQPFERERLADPIMSWSRDLLSGQHREHVHVVREASRGATGVQGTGCGCN